MRVLILQFIKGGWEYGELKAIEALKGAGGRIEARRCGLGFTRRGSSREDEHRAAAADALRQARDAVSSGDWDMIVLDEMNYAVKFGLVPVEEALALIDGKPPSLHLVLTGRDAHESVIARADLVTEMNPLKHHFETGVKAQPGIEF